MTVHTKASLMRAIAQGLAQEIFSHAELGEFNVTLMRAAAERMLYENRVEIVHVALDQIIGHIMTDRVTEPARVMGLGTESWEDDPGLIVHYESDNSHLLIDGHHRAMRRNAEGKETMPFFLLKEKDIIRPDYRRPHWKPDWGDKIIDPITGKVRERVGGEHG